MFENETEITRKVLISLGLEIQPGTNLVIDQETKSQLAFDELFIKANINPNSPLYISEHDIKFEPLNPKCTKLMDRMFGKFLDNESSEDIMNIPEVLTFYFDKDYENKTNRLTIKFEDGTSWIGNWYLNKILCYIEAIFSIDGTFADTDLRPYDIDQNLREQ